MKSDMTPTDAIILFWFCLTFSVGVILLVTGMFLDGVRWKGRWVGRVFWKTGLGIIMATVLAMLVGLLIFLGIQAFQ